MKVVILAGGYGTRLSEETKLKPKPLVEIGDKPIIWHIMKIYSFYGMNDFIICLGYKGHMIKKNLKKYARREKWKISFVNTGLHTMTGGRIRRIKSLVENDKNFCLSYGDGLSNVNLKRLIKFHYQNKKIATLTAVKYKNPKGILSINKKSLVKKIKEKPLEYINGGFFVLSKNIFKYIQNDKTIFEKDCLPKLSITNKLAAYKHNDFWACMDTLREKKELNLLWKNKRSKWKIWK
tara:strand:- start:9721 stop:10428 length:708 start_codon:yes stop_codon:yes gene_type:complete